jgi:hypothetical protein
MGNIPRILVEQLHIQTISLLPLLFDSVMDCSAMKVFSAHFE